jgi:hypothetical protein
VADPEGRKRKHQDYAARLVRIDPSGARQD